MCSTFTPDCGYDISTIILNGDVYCPNTKCSDKLCLHEKVFQTLDRSDYQCPQRASVFQLPNNPFEDHKKSFFLVACSMILLFWRESKINSRSYWSCVFSWKVLFQQRKMRICWRLCNYTEIHLWLWKVWSLFVCSQSSFYVTRARKDDKNTLLLC